MIATVDDMRQDVTRLEKIASRFSQIGSQPALKIQSLNPLLEDI
ncbi:MAG: hypothetical protein U5R06_18830 [candidate division KSB1 bacterium]|nr:hypothetical protein [candidate division KSB1 bacterium]